MTEKPRITLQFQKNADGTVYGVDILLNSAGISLLVERLESLSETDDHFHLFSSEWDPDGELSVIPYDKHATVGDHIKVLFRPDKWDREYYPHLFDDSDPQEQT